MEVSLCWEWQIKIKVWLAVDVLYSQENAIDLILNDNEIDPFIIMRTMPLLDYNLPGYGAKQDNKPGQPNDTMKAIIWIHGPLWREGQQIQIPLIVITTIPLPSLHLKFYYSYLNYLQFQRLWDEAGVKIVAVILSFIRTNMIMNVQLQLWSCWGLILTFRLVGDQHQVAAAGQGQRK